MTLNRVLGSPLKHWIFVLLYPLAAFRALSVEYGNLRFDILCRENGTWPGDNIPLGGLSEKYRVLRDTLLADIHAFVFINAILNF